MGYLDTIMKSSSGNFSLVLEGGGDVDTVFWKGLGTRNPEYNNKYLIQIYLKDCGQIRIDEIHTKYKYNSSYVYTGMKTNEYTHAELEEYIELLQEAIEFSKKINKFIEQSDEWHE